MREIKIKPSKKFPDGIGVIYTLEEARHYNIKFYKYQDWRKANYGEYAQTFDGYVTPVIKRNDRSDPKYLKTPTGCFAINRPGTIFDTGEFVNRNSFTRKSRWNGTSPKLTSNQVIFFDVLSRTLNIDRAIKLAYPNAKYQSDIDSWKEQILKSRLFKEYMKKFRDKFIAAGITEDLLIEKLADLLPKASCGTYPALAKMAAAGLGSSEMFEEQKQLPSGKETPLFDQIENAEDAEFDDIPMKLGPVRKEAS